MKTVYKCNYIFIIFGYYDYICHNSYGYYCSWNLDSIKRKNDSVYGKNNVDISNVDV